MPLLRELNIVGDTKNVLIFRERWILVRFGDARPSAGSSQPRPTTSCQSLPPHRLTFADAQVEGQGLELKVRGGRE